MRTRWLIPGIFCLAACGSSSGREERWLQAPILAEASEADLGALDGAASLGFGAKDAGGGVWLLSPESRVPWTILQPRERHLALELSGAPDLPHPTTVEAFWNGVSLGPPSQVSPAPAKLDFTLGEELQLLGQNWLCLRFAGVEQPRRRVLLLREASLSDEPLALSQLYSHTVRAPDRPATARGFWLKTDSGAVAPGQLLEEPALQALALHEARQNLDLPPPEPPPATPAPSLLDQIPASPRTIRNVVVVLLDACRGDDLGAYGDPQGATPHLDRLAREGLEAVQVQASAAYTLASAGALMTGIPPLQLGLISDHGRLPDGVKTLSESFAEAGFRTAAFSASPYVTEQFGFARGFESFAEFYRDPLYVRQGRRASLILERAGEWLAKQPPDQKLFAYLHLREPHQPYDPLFPWSAAFQPPANSSSATGENSWILGIEERRRLPTQEDIARIHAYYRGGLFFADSMVGLLLDELRRSGRLESTLLVVISDHGEAFFEHQRLAHNSTVHDEMLRVPFLLWNPALEPRLLDAPASTTDLGPAISRVAGFEFGPAAEPRPEAILSQTSSDPPILAWRAARYKLIGGSHVEHPRLFDLAADPLENVDIARRRPVTSAWMRLRLAEFIARMEEVRLKARPSGDSQPQTANPDPAAEEEMRALGYIK